MDKQYIIRLYNHGFTVTEEQYKDFYRMKRRVKYLGEQDEAHGLVSYQAKDGDAFSGEEYLVDAEQESVEDAVVRKVMVEHLRRCLDKLTVDEMFLINALFFDRKSERELSAITAIPQKTINDRKKRILLKLIKFFEN